MMDFMLGTMYAIHELIMGKLQEARPKDVVWGLFAFNALMVSWSVFIFNRILQRRHERLLRIKRVDNRRIRPVFFDFTGNTLRCQPLPHFSLEDWDESLCKLVRSWNRIPRESAIITPDSPEDAAALSDVLHTEASELLVNCCDGIRGFLQDDQIINEDDGFKHVRFLVALARPPKQSIDWFDAARLIIVPINSAKRLAKGTGASCVSARLTPRNRETWCTVLREMGLRYIQHQNDRDTHGRFGALAIVDIAFVQ